MNLGKLLMFLKTPLVFGLFLSLLVACQSPFQIEKNDNSDKKRATLADLADEQIARDLTQKEADDNPFILSKKQREVKLAALYQNILTIEPNEEIRTQISYRLAQIDTQAYELKVEETDNPNENAKALSDLIISYEALLARYPNRTENEEVHYQLAKALSLQGDLEKSLQQIELILAKYPESKYRAELHFRRGDIYYNLQYYTKALSEYQAVIASKNNSHHYVNSVYMSGWTLFKLNRLKEADKTFLHLLDFIIAQEKIQPLENNFNFSSLDRRYVDLVNDVQRVLSISLSQQSQAKSLVSLVENYQGNEFNDNNLYLYRHILFKNLADFLLQNGLIYDAELTYQSFITLSPDSLWAARYTLQLIELYRTQGKHQAIQRQQVQYVKQFGMESNLWKKSLISSLSHVANKEHLMTEILPNLVVFSYQQSRYLYAQAQSETIEEDKVSAFSNASHWLNIYLSLAKLPQAEKVVQALPSSQGLLADELLFADASFEAQLYQQALKSYEYIAYRAPVTPQLTSELMRKEAAYAATLTTRAMLADTTVANRNSLFITRTRLDRSFIEHYPTDERSSALAVQQAQFSFANKEYQSMQFFCDFVLQTYGVDNNLALNVIEPQQAAANVIHKDRLVNLTGKAIKEIQIASQLQANYWYHQEDYPQAELGYNLALQYVVENSTIWHEMRELLSASIYFQGQHLALTQPLLAVEHFLRLGKLIPESSYRLNAHFDAANILLAQQQWQEAIDVFLAFQLHYPTHEYSHSIPAKLAQSYEHLAMWDKAAVQYLAIIDLVKTEPNSSELQREALYSAAELYLKANNLDKAISTFREYAHTYPEPFEVAQEVRFKMSQFYQQTKEPNKEYYWYRKILSFHDQNINDNNRIDHVRAKYLASVAALGLGQAHQQTFKQIKLTLPLKKSLLRKQKAMKTAIDYYKKLLSFQLSEFVPHGTYNLAQMYRQLSQDVMSSQRPKDLDELALEEYDILLEEIIYPFEEKAIEIHTSNAQRAWQNIYDPWVRKSFAALAEIEPALYDRSYKKTNSEGGVINAIHTIH